MGEERQYYHLIDPKVFAILLRWKSGKQKVGSGWQAARSTDHRDHHRLMNTGEQKCNGHYEGRTRDLGVS
jgi:hypothetical protein